VDHGFTAPFDLDSLRNKVEGRFESVDKLSKGKRSEITVRSDYVKVVTTHTGSVHSVHSFGIN